MRGVDIEMLRNWSNLEAQYEMASLLAHPKSSITNIWGGTLHTIQSAGIAALAKARSIKYLKRINLICTCSIDLFSLFNLFLLFNISLLILGIIYCK